jgi:hypothetical protein
MEITGRALFRRQSGQAWWIYFLLTVIYSMYVLLDHDDFEQTATWKLLLPIAALMGLIVFPTLAGWVLVFASTLSYILFAFSMLCYYISQDGFNAQYIFACLFLTLLAFLCYHLTQILRVSFAAK